MLDLSIKERGSFISSNAPIKFHVNAKAPKSRVGKRRLMIAMCCVLSQGASKHDLARVPIITFRVELLDDGTNYCVEKVRKRQREQVAIKFFNKRKERSEKLKSNLICC